MDHFVVTKLDNGCEEVDRFRNPDGYYPFNFRGWRGLLHRWLYEMVYGPIPEGMVIRHLCNNRACINIHHLAIGTHADNVADRVAAGRSACGVRNGRNKLSESQVREIRNSSVSPCELAKKYGVDAKLIRLIRDRKIWKGVE